MLTPARGKSRDQKDAVELDNGLETGGAAEFGKGKARGLWDSDSDEEGEDGMGGMSPPKTMQFHVPRERLLRTPGM